MQKRIRWRQRWYNVKCGCSMDSFLSDERAFQQKHGTTKSLRIFRVMCNVCSHFHWTYDVLPDDPIITFRNDSSLYIGTGISRLENCTGTLPKNRGCV